MIVEKQSTNNISYILNKVGIVVAKDGRDFADFLRVLQAEPDGAANDPAGQDPLVLCQLPHQSVRDPRDVLVDGVLDGSWSSVSPLSPQSKLLLVLQ